MNLDELKDLLEVVRAHGLTEFELEREGFKIRIRRDGATPGLAAAAGFVPGPAAPVAVPPSDPAAASGVPGLDPTAVDLAIVKSPIVGTFYRAPQPGAPLFVDLGQTVRKGQVVCIIEAMKLMNEIESEYDGEVIAVYVENGKPVQFGERLFAVRPR